MQKNKGDIAAQRKRYREKHREQHNALNRKSSFNTRLAVLTHYTDGYIRCSKCGERHIEFLAITRTTKPTCPRYKAITGKELYTTLKVLGFPKGFEVACHNCIQKKVKEIARNDHLVNGEYDQRKSYRKRDRKRALAFEHYSNGKEPACACCGVTDPELLCIDHINGDGEECRRKHPGQLNIYQWLKQNNYPPGFRILCANCNQAIGIYGSCPHTKVQSIQPSTIPATEPQ